MNSSIFIEYETKTREFDGKLLLINHLLNTGFEKIYFGAGRPLRKEALYQKNGVYCFKSISVNEIPFYKKLKALGYTLCLIHAEGGVYYRDSSSSIESMFNQKALRFFDFNFVFGEEIKNNIEKVYGVAASQICIVTGEPRFDLLKNKYLDFFKTDILNKKKEYGNYILINTSFSASNPKAGEAVLRDYWLNEPTFSKKTKDLLMFKMDFFIDVLKLFIEAIEHISLENPDLNFVIRPHPSESWDVYEKTFKTRKNVFVTNIGNVAPWIIGSCGVIHYDCTTGIETLLAKKPVISFAPIIDDKIVAWLPIKVSKLVTSLEQLNLEVKTISNNSYQEHLILDEDINILNGIISNFYQESSPIIAKKLIEYIKCYKFNDTLKAKVFRFLNTINYDFRMSLKTCIYRIKGINDVGNDKRGNFENREVQNKLETIINAEGFSFKFKIRKHSKHSCIIENVKN